MGDNEGVRQPWLLWWGAAFAWWTLNGFSSASQYHLMRGSSSDAVTWEHALATGLTSAYLWVPLTMLAVWLAGRFPLERSRLPTALAVHFGAAIFVCVIRAIAVLLLNLWIGWYPELPPFRSILITSFGNNFFFYWMLTGVAHAVHYAQQSRRRERQAAALRTELVRAQLQSLKSQLHPHFLFNTLNAIAAFVHHDPGVADRMITRLSELLRRALDDAGTEEVPLRDELRFLEAYLEIEQARFGNRLRVRWNIEPAALDACVPHLMLQPLAENAIRHGISPRSAPGTVEISAWRENGSLHVRVRDDGVGLPDGRAGSAGGVGLPNTRARLEQMYGDGYGLQVANVAGGGAAVTLRLPFRANATAEPFAGSTAE